MCFLLDLPRLQHDILAGLLEPTCRLVPVGSRREAGQVVAAGGADVVVAGLPGDALGVLRWLADVPSGVRVLLVARGGRLVLELLGELSPEALASAVHHHDPGGTAGFRAARA